MQIWDIECFVFISSETTNNLLIEKRLSHQPQMRRKCILCSSRSKLEKLIQLLSVLRSGFGIGDGNSKSTFCFAFYSRKLVISAPSELQQISRNGFLIIASTGNGNGNGNGNGDTINQREGKRWQSWCVWRAAHKSVLNAPVWFIRGAAADEIWKGIVGIQNNQP